MPLSLGESSDLATLLHLRLGSLNRCVLRTVVSAGEGGDTEAFLLHLGGMHVLYLDGERIYGDPYESGYIKQHVDLSVGNHTVAIPFLVSGKRD